jgi:hypothetical protein
MAPNSTWRNPPPTLLRTRPSTKALGTFTHHPMMLTRSPWGEWRQSTPEWTNMRLTVMHNTNVTHNVTPRATFKLMLRSSHPHHYHTRNSNTTTSPPHRPSVLVSPTFGAGWPTTHARWPTLHFVNRGSNNMRGGRRSTIDPLVIGRVVNEATGFDKESFNRSIKMTVMTMGPNTDFKQWTRIFSPSCPQGGVTYPSARHRRVRRLAELRRTMHTYCYRTLQARTSALIRRSSASLMLPLTAPELHEAFCVSAWMIARSHALCPC